MVHMKPLERQLLTKVYRSKWVFPKIGGFSPKMDGENNGKHPINPWMIWGVSTPLFSETAKFQYAIQGNSASIDPSCGPKSDGVVFLPGVP